MLFKTDAEKAFGVETYLSPEMDKAIKLWGQMEKGNPPWVGKKVQSISFSNTIAEELAKLITQNIDIKVQGIWPGPLPEQMQNVMDKYFKDKAMSIMHDVVSFGGVMLKWDYDGIDRFRNGEFLPTETDSSKEILAAIFLSNYRDGKKVYTRMEWHRFEDETEKAENGEMVPVRAYYISTKAFVSDNENDIGRPVSLEDTKWKDILPEVRFTGLEKPLFRYIKCPVSNTIDHSSPLGVPAFANCLVELEALDIAMSALKTETKNSTPIMMVDQSVIQFADANGIELPEFICNTGYDLSDGKGEPVHDWQPTLQTTTRIEGINFYFSVIGFKCGFDPGMFVFDGQTVSMATATQVESTERRTVNTVLSYRSVLDSPNSNGDGRVGAIHDIAYIINAGLIINGKRYNIPRNEYGNYELFCDFADISVNKQEDMMLDLQLANQGFIPKVEFLVKHRGYTRVEARRMVEEARKENEMGQESKLFGEE